MILTAEDIKAWEKDLRLAGPVTSPRLKEELTELCRLALIGLTVQPDRVAALEAALRPFAIIGADKKHKDLGDHWCINVPVPDLRRAAAALKSD